MYINVVKGMSSNEFMKMDDVLYYLDTKKIYYDGSHLVNVQNDGNRPVDDGVFKVIPPNKYDRGIVKNFMLVFFPPSLKLKVEE